MVYHFTALTASPYAARHRQRIPGWLRDKACAHIYLIIDHHSHQEKITKHKLDDTKIMILIVSLLGR